MKNHLIGALVAGLILFFWQFLSWGLLELHGSQMNYTPSQDAILTALEESGLEEGQYFLPRMPFGTAGDKVQEFQMNQVGKPWATITYRKAMTNTMGMNMFRGFIIDFIAAFLLCWVLGKMASLDFKTCLLTSLAIGLISYMTLPYINSIWFETNSLPDLLDAVVSWGIVGAWLGWWLPSRV